MTIANLLTLLLVVVVVLLLLLLLGATGNGNSGPASWSFASFTAPLMHSVKDVRTPVVPSDERFEETAN
jgi:hypothetical protein